MSEQKMTRRELLAKAAAASVLLVGAGAVLSACKADAGGGGGGAAPAAPAAATCEDVSALSDADKATRNSLKYASKSPEAAKNCAGCSLYVPGQPCGTCKVVKGPIAAEGWCSAFAPKPA